jgi:NAD(P)-dependent dehydrogenase (short-subunit alcohol dehydrogenase family)
MADDITHETATGRFDGRCGVALVVGGSGAIGRAICERLAVLGANVVLTYARNRKAAEEAAASVEDLGGKARAVQMLLEDESSVTSAIDTVVRDSGGIHTAVLAASPVNSQSYVSLLTGARYVEQLRIDAGGSFFVVSAILPALRQSQGSLVALSSVANRRFVLRDVLSTTSKAANEALVRAVAAEEGRFGVRANAVGVGILSEGMTLELKEAGDIRSSDLEHARSQIPLRELGAASAIASTVAFLASDQACYITGQWIDVDGGYSL